MRSADRDKRRNEPNPNEEALLERILFYLRLFPNTETEYNRLHATVPADLQDAIRESNFRNMTGFRRRTDV